MQQQQSGQLAFVTCTLIALKCHSGFNVEFGFVSEVIKGNSYHNNKLSCMKKEYSMLPTGS